MTKPPAQKCFKISTARLAGALTLVVGLGCVMQACDYLLTLSAESEWTDCLQAMQQDNIPKTLAACDAAPQSCDPRIAAWGQFIEAVSQVADPRVKAELVNGWINTVIVYDADKSDAIDASAWTPPASYRHKTFLQTPFDTLRGGKGICGDQAILKYETLKLAGFPARDMELVSGLQRLPSGPGEHMALVVEADGQRLLLNNQSAPGLAPDAPEGQIIGTFAFNAEPWMLIPALPKGSGWLQTSDQPSFFRPETISGDPGSQPFLDGAGSGRPCARGEKLACAATDAATYNPYRDIVRTSYADIEQALAPPSPAAPAPLDRTPLRPTLIQPPLLRSVAAAFTLSNDYGS